MSDKPTDDIYKGNGRTSHVRFYVILVTALMSVLLYLDRFCISFAEVFIKQELRLSDGQIGWLFTAFFLVYALAQVPSGYLTDRFGPRVMLTLYILLWSACTGLIGLAFGFVTLLLLRGGIGLFQAGAYPTAANVVSNWVPFSARGMASSVIAVGGRIGGFLALFLTGILIVKFVPLSVSSRLTKDDFRNVPEFCFSAGTALTLETPPYTPEDPQEQDPGLSHLREKFRPLMDEETKREIAPVASVYQDARRAEQKGGESADVANNLRKSAKSKAEAIRPGLLKALNAFISTRHDFDPKKLAGFKLEREAKSLLEKHSSELSQEEYERLNRLVLEAAFPKSVMKVYSAGWRQVMWTYGILGIVVAGLFWLICRNRPADHPRVTAAELETIEYGRPETAPKPGVGSKGIPLVRLLTSRSMWLLCISMWFTNVGWVFVVTWSPRYLAQAHEIPVEQRALMTSIPLLVGWFGMLSGGHLTDWLVGRIGLRWGRALPMSLSRFLAMLAYVYILTHPSPWGAVAAFSLVAFATDLGTGSIWAFNQDVGGRNVGSILGWSNMWGNLGAAAAPPFLIFVIGETFNWNAAFITCGVAFLLSGLLCLLVDATVPIAKPDEEEKSD